jgi:hypothetical protein
MARSKKAEVAAPATTNGWHEDPSRGMKDAAHLEAMESAPLAKFKPIQVNLPVMNIQTIKLTIVGDAPLLVHHWSQKSIKQMLDKQMGNATAGREPKNPEQEYQDSLYRLPDGLGYGFPAIAFKDAAVSACTSLGKSVTKVQARQCFHVVGKLVQIHGEPRMREDAVTVGQGSADLRYRGEFDPWWTELEIRFNANVLTASQVVNLFNTAGFAVGVGEFRPECNGDCGLFHVKTG